MTDEWVLIPARYLRDEVVYRSVCVSGDSAVRFCGFQTEEGCARRVDQWVSLPQLHLMYIMEGQAQLQIEQEGRHDLSPGDVIQILPQTRYRLIPDTGWACARLGLNADFGRWLERLGILKLDRLIYHAGLKLEMIEQFDQIAVSLRNSPDESLAWTVLQVQQLLMELSSSHETSSDDLISRCCVLLGENLDQSLSVEDLAGTLKIHAARLRQQFRDRVGMDPNTYREHKRIDRAMSMLGDQAISLDQIAQRLGYRDVGMFSVQFKRIVGQSPLQYRQTST